MSQFSFLPILTLSLAVFPSIPSSYLPLVLSFLCCIPALFSTSISPFPYPTLRPIFSSLLSFFFSFLLLCYIPPSTYLVLHFSHTSHGASLPSIPLSCLVSLSALTSPAFSSSLTFSLFVPPYLPPDPLHSYSSSDSPSSPISLLILFQCPHSFFFPPVPPSICPFLHRTFCSFSPSIPPVLLFLLFLHPSFRKQTSL